MAIVVNRLVAHSSMHSSICSHWHTHLKMLPQAYENVGESRFFHSTLAKGFGERETDQVIRYSVLVYIT